MPSAADAAILSLADITPEDTARVGAKAAVLARLRQAGFPVPEAFCIP